MAIRMPKPKAKRSKYRNIRTEYAGILYDSKGEANRAAELDLMQSAGLIKWWQPKPGTIRLGCPENCYRPDFIVAGHEYTYYEDFKGTWTSKFKSNLAKWKVYGPCPLHITSKGKVTEIVQGGGKKLREAS